MAEWTTSTQANARPDQVLEVLTHPDAIRRWAPIDFDVEDSTACGWRPVAPRV